MDSAECHHLASCFCCLDIEAVGLLKHYLDGVFRHCRAMVL